MPVGGLLGGVLGETVGVRETLLIAAIGTALTWLPVYLSPLLWQRELPSYVPDNETGSPLVESRP
jgi:hypothetical protein